MLVELKNGETYNGHLVSCDNWMNICLRDVICTSRDGDRFWKLPELVVRGNNIKYLRIPEEVLVAPAPALSSPIRTGRCYCPVPPPLLPLKRPVWGCRPLTNTTTFPLPIFCNADVHTCTNNDKERCTLTGTWEGRGGVAA